MGKLIGYCEMKKKKGKVLFLVYENAKGCVGHKTDVKFVYDDMADSISSACIGKNISFTKGLTID